jgi:hypothetical protein
MKSILQVSTDCLLCRQRVHLGIKWTGFGNVPEMGGRFDDRYWYTIPKNQGLENTKEIKD